MEKFRFATHNRSPAVRETAAVLLEIDLSVLKGSVQFESLVVHCSIEGDSLDESCVGLSRVQGLPLVVVLEVLKHLEAICTLDDAHALDLDAAITL